MYICTSATFQCLTTQALVHAMSYQTFTFLNWTLHALYRILVADRLMNQMVLERPPSDYTFSTNRDKLTVTRDRSELLKRAKRSA
jgi:hypothetical protein